jgi:hypothetical protein
MVHAMLHAGSLYGIPSELRCTNSRTVRGGQSAPCARRHWSSCVPRNGRVAATSELQSSPTELNDKFHGSDSPGSLASFEEFLTFEPEDFELEEGAVSNVNRSSPMSPDDVFRCPGCTKADCQVRSGHSTLVSAAALGLQYLETACFMHRDPKDAQQRPGVGSWTDIYGKFSQHASMM